jgi:hypothetical protein
MAVRARIGKNTCEGPDGHFLGHFCIYSFFTIKKCMWGRMGFAYSIYVFRTFFIIKKKYM